MKNKYFYVLKKLDFNYFQLQLYLFIKNNITNKKEKGSGLVN